MSEDDKASLEFVVENHHREAIGRFRRLEGHIDSLRGLNKARDTVKIDPSLTSDLTSLVKLGADTPKMGAKTSELIAPTALVVTLFTYGKEAPLHVVITAAALAAVYIVCRSWVKVRGK